MSAFHEICEDFSRLISEFEFVPLYALWPSNEIILGKVVVEPEGIFSYVRAGTSKNGAFWTTLWIAPLDGIDDGLDANCAAIQIPISENFNVDGSYYRSCEERLLKLLPEAFLLAEPVRREIASPSYVGRCGQEQIKKRMKVWMNTFNVYRELKQSSTFCEVKSLVVSNHSKKKKNIKEIESACAKWVDFVLKSGSPEQISLIRECNPCEQKWLVRDVAEYAYIDCACSVAAR